MIFYYRKSSGFKYLHTCLLFVVDTEFFILYLTINKPIQSFRATFYCFMQLTIFVVRPRTALMWILKRAVFIAYGYTSFRFWGCVSCAKHGVQQKNKNFYYHESWSTINARKILYAVAAESSACLCSSWNVCAKSHSLFEAFHVQEVQCIMNLFKTYSW